MIKFPVLYEDNDILVFDKPSGLVVDRSETQKDKNNTLEGLLEENRGIFGIEEGLERMGIVHRLDKETSGVLIIAKNERSLKSLRNQFKKRKVKKFYFALVNGRVGEDKFNVDAPIGRNPRNRMRFSVHKEGKEAYTEFEKVKEKSLDDHIYTLLKVNPHTGRTHQIRVHLAAAGFPVVSDPLYAPARIYNENIKRFKRLMLHAGRIEFKHPNGGAPVSFESKLPKQFEIGR